MALIQFIGFPEITDELILKFGFVPVGNNQFQWYVEIKSRVDNALDIIPVKSRNEAREFINKIVRGEYKHYLGKV